jgi:hypothetical protein
MLNKNEGEEQILDEGMIAIGGSESGQLERRSDRYSRKAEYYEI